jgi:hypothetical protein
MSRARNIKPGFFRSADLVEVSFQARLLFIGLWTLADRAGRLEDRVKQIKMELFPADAVDCNACLEELVVIGVIGRYEVNGKRFIQVVNFARHQNPHRDEKPSVIPKPDGSTDGPPAKHGASTVQARCPADADMAPAQRHDDADPVPAQGRAGADRLPIGLIPDSLSLIPDSISLIPELAPQAPAAEAVTPKRGTRLPKPWALPRAWGDWALAEFPAWGVDTVRNEAAKFADHWHAKVGQDARKADWFATWRNWCRNARMPAQRGRAGVLTDAQRQDLNNNATAEALRLLGATAGAGDVIDAH